MRSTPGQDRHASLVCDCDDCSRGGNGGGWRAIQGVHMGERDAHH